MVMTMNSKDILNRFNILNELTDALANVSHNLAVNNHTTDDKQLLNIVNELSIVLNDYLHYDKDK